MIEWIVSGVLVAVLSAPGFVIFYFLMRRAVAKSNYDKVVANIKRLREEANL